MAADTQNHNISLITSKQPPEGKVCTAQGSTAKVSRAGRIEKGIAHKPCGAGLSVPAIKTDKAYDQETIEISTNKVK